jgi:hypothetical protein
VWRRWRKVKRRRVIKMTPPPQSLCFVTLMTTICFVFAVAQTPDLEEPSADGAYTATTLESGSEYRNSDAAS